MRRTEVTASSVRKLTPPSEKESGVTFTTPITDGRGNRCSAGARTDTRRNLLSDGAAEVVARKTPELAGGVAECAHLGGRRSRPLRTLDQPQPEHDRRAAGECGRRQLLTEDEHRPDHAEDRDEQGERDRARGADPADALVEEDEAEHGPEDRTE